LFNKFDRRISDLAVIMNIKGFDFGGFTLKEEIFVVRNFRKLKNSRNICILWE